MQTFMTQALRIALVSALLLCTGLASGCGPIIIPLPPPVPTATGLNQTAQGGGEIGVGMSAVTNPVEAIQNQGEAIVPNIAGGMIPTSLRFGLSDRVDVQGTWGLYVFGYNVGGQLGIKVWEDDKNQLGLTLGSGLYGLKGSYQVSETVTDEEGQIVYDENGNAVLYHFDVDYAYFGLSPQVGVRGAHRINEQWTGVASLTATYSQTFERYGLEGQDMPGQLFLEPTLGVIWHPVKEVELGLSVTGYPSMDPTLLSPTLSFSYLFGVR